jgi:hypothetical protein
MEYLGILIPILALLIGMVGTAGGIWLKGQKIKLELAQAQGGIEATANKVTQAELEKLKERVAVLERLITDEDRRVSSEINRLRTGPGVTG